MRNENYTVYSAPKGQEISAPHAAKRNMGLQMTQSENPERMTENANDD
ncbi:hypothetical protein Barb6_01951 [Bacteroidales bacterium Barb6]|nr:hypothetical protein Barb6_01951 [Bacteroidales bacterium Barb6]